jgi:predicted Ser/Thr protein kinase
MTQIEECVNRPPGKPCEYHGYVVEAVLQNGDVHKARVLLARKGEQRVVIKELSEMRPVFRFLYGRRMLRREARTLEALAGFESAPQLVERISPDAIAIQFVQSHYLPRKLPDARKPRVMAAFRRAVDGLHARGVVHFDLRQRKNVLVSRENAIVLIDFESSFVFGTTAIGRWLQSWFARVDRSAVLKWQLHYLPKRLTADERKQIEIYRGLKRFWIFKRVGRKIRRLFGRD